MKSKQLLFLLLVLYTIPHLVAQTIIPRLNQGALLEPQGKIINGAGQDLAAYKNYWNVMHAQNKPLIFMTYIGLKDATSNWTEGLKADLMMNSGKFQIAQIGLSMTTDGTPTSHYEQNVAAGQYDNQIRMFIDGLQALAMPAYVRIGYEFNGTSWNGYVPNTYIKAYQRITNMIRARGIEVATIWDLAMDGVMNYMDYYPGDEYVDWWAINMFSASHFTDINAKNFLAAARSHKKPVMIGETTPRNVGVLNGQQSWDQWFAPFFTFIHSNPEIKAFSYIDYNWSQYPQWSTWGDARLEQNTVVGGQFANEMDSLKYLHASTEKAFRETLGSSDHTAPDVPGIVAVTAYAYPLQLTWDAVTDPSGISHYMVYKNGVLLDYTLKLPYYDQNITAGEAITYAVSAMDRAGNESPKTPDLKVTVPLTLSKTFNGEFNSGTESWQFSTYDSGAAALMKIDTTSAVSGRLSCVVTLSKVTGTDWHVQLWQWLPVHQGRKYSITFKAKASAARTITLAVQQGASPYTVYFSKTHTLSTTVQTFTDLVTINTSDQAKLEFMLGNSTSSVWIDAISVVESYEPPVGVTEMRQSHEGFYLQQNYPNPFHSTTTIKYKVTEPAFVSLKVFDIMGTEVASLVNEQKPVGDYTIDWNASGWEGGIYFCRLQAGSVSQTKKLVLQK